MCLITHVLYDTIYAPSVSRNMIQLKYRTTVYKSLPVIHALGTMHLKVMLTAVSPVINTERTHNPNPNPNPNMNSISCTQECFRIYSLLCVLQSVY